MFDSEADSEQPVRNLRTNYIRYPGVTTSVEREIQGFAVPGVESPYVWERENARGDHHGFARSIAGRVDKVAILVTGTAGGPGWPWDQLVAIAGIQASMIQEAGAHRTSSVGVVEDLLDVEQVVEIRSAGGPGVMQDAGHRPGQVVGRDVPEPGL